MAKHGVLGISFDHMHMGDLLRQVAEHPDAEIAGIFDPDRKRMENAIATFGISEDRFFDSFVMLQTRKVTTPTEVPADKMPAGRRGPIEYLLARIEDGAPISGPLDPALSLVGQRMIDSAVLSAASKHSVPLVR
jgi:predicted dehydrogenase